MSNIPHSYIQRVIIGTTGKETMKLASKVADDVMNNKSIDYLNVCDQSTNIALSDSKTFSQELKEYVDRNQISQF